MSIEVVLVDSTEEVAAFWSWLGEKRPVLAFDIETTGLDPWRDETRLVQFGDAETGWAIPHRDWRGLVRDVLTRYEGPIVAHNAKFDSSFMERDGITVPRPNMHDTMTMCHLVDSHGPKALKPAAARYVGPGAAQGERELKEAMRKAKWTWATIPVEFEPYYTYAALDTVITARLAETLWSRVQPQREAYEREIAVTWVLMDMETRGARVDVDYCRAARDRLQDELAEIQKRWDLNMFSGAQVIDALEKDDVRITKRTKNGNPSVDEDSLSSIDHPLARDVLAARERKKLIGSYFTPFIEMSVDGVLHPSIHPLGAEKTGRMSISRPGMQTLPRKKLVRDAIIPRDDGVLILADYQGMEMRVMAHYSEDENMIAAYRRGEDIHLYTASEIFGTEDVSKEQRMTAKHSGFTKIYGGGYKKFAVTAGIPIPQAREVYARYDRLFPGVPRFQRQIADLVAKREQDGWGWIRTWGGRVVRVEARNAYKGVNYLIQGGCADIFKQGLVEADRAGISQYLTLPVHDETVADAPLDVADEVEHELKEAMERYDLRVPLLVDSQQVASWGEPYE